VPRKPGAADAAAVAQLFDTALRLHEDGQLQRAEYLYRDVLRQAPGHAPALNMLGVIGCQTGNLSSGAALIRRALELDPDNPGFSNNLGMAHLQMGEAQAAIECFERAVRVQPRFAEAQFNLANAYLAVGNEDAAEKHYRKALRVHPDFADALNNLGNLLRQRGRAHEALPLLRRLVARRPTVAGAQTNLALALQATGALDEAVAVYRTALALDARQGAVWESLARCERLRGALIEAEAAYEQAIALGPPSAERFDALGLVQFARSRVAAARASFERACALDPRFAPAHEHLGMTWAASGDRARASASFERAVEIDPRQVGAWRALADMSRTEATARVLVTRIRAQLEACAGDPRALAELDYALGKLHDDLREFPAAFAAYGRANAARRSAIDFDRGAQAAFIDALIEVFDSTYFRTLPARGVTSEVPVLIVGMPRSGTTLVEQILASHRDVHGAGELTFFPERIPALPRLLDTRKPFPHCVPGNLERIEGLAQEYLDLLTTLGGAARRVTDKMPYNFLYLGVIAALLPQARVVHCRRDAMATCWSIFAHDLAGNHPYSYAFDDLAAAYVGYERLLGHWATVLPLAFYELDYETLLDRPDSTVRDLVGFLGLPWDGACLAFDRNQRAVTTASQWQIRQPLYTASRDHWRHYETCLSPLRAALEEERLRQGMQPSLTA
jgi:tetratricopeptide (TPR) repeat protein